ncbi:MAG: type II secretion system protein [Gallionella sp.]|nr:type II secretion system protein [Gallionella sp.]
MRVHGQSGFTLTEMIMVIVITGILGSMAAVFLRAPVQQYLDIGQRADLTDIADLALRRMTNDVGTAVPSSVRVAGIAPIYLEFLPTKDGGRYRAVSSTPDVCAGVAGNAGSGALVFDGADTCFEILGPAVSFVVDDRIVVGSTQPGGNPYDTAATGMLRRYAGAAGAQVSAVIDSGFPLAATDTSQRFEVVPVDQRAVTYACIGTLGTLDTNGDGQGKLVRYWNYGFNSAQVAPPVGGSSAVLANKLYTCGIVVDQSRGLIANTLQFARASEVISLYQEIHVHSSPTIHVHNTP